MKEPSSYEAVVIGGGLTGLTAAHRLSREGRRVLLLEAAPEVGGVVRTLHQDGWVFELGPNTVMARGALAGLIDELGLQDEVLTARPSARRRYVFKGGSLEPLPTGPGGFLTTRLFSVPARLRLLAEPFVPRRRDLAVRDESIADFVRRRLGQPWLDYAIGPFVSGVHGGDPERLSVRWAVPKIAALEREHGSLIRGAIAKRKGASPRGTMLTFREGLRTLPRALASGVHEVRCNAAVRRIDPTEGRYRLRGDGWAVQTRQLIVAVGAPAASELTRGLEAGEVISQELKDLPQAPIVVVSLGYRRDQVRHVLDGFGFLAPRCESLRLLGCLFPSSVFEGRAPAGHVSLSAFFGGSLDSEVVELEDSALLDLTVGELDATLGLSGSPTLHRITRWNPAIPQYELGHERIAAAVSSVEAANPGLHCVGNYLGGASVPDSVEKGEAVARSILRPNR